MVAELSHRKSNRESINTSFLPDINNKSLHIKDQALREIIEYLWMNVVEDKSVLYLLIFVWAIEQDEEVTRFIKDKTDNFEGYDFPEVSQDDPSEIVVKDPIVLNKTFSYALNLRSYKLLQYIFDGSQKLFLSPWITEDQIVDLIFNQSDPNVQSILKLLWKKDITLVNEAPQQIDSSDDDETMTKEPELK